MAEKDSAWEPMGLERFGHLEDKLYRFVETFKAVRKEIASLREENQRLKEEVEGFRASDSARQESVTQLQQERQELRERVEKALEMLAALEDH